VVVHGGPDLDHEYLLPELDLLASTYRLVYYDQRGRGRSFDGTVPAEISMRTEAADLDAVRRGLRLGTIAVLGHSWGALVALEYAVAFPDHLSALILMNPAPVSARDAAALRRHLSSRRTEEQSAAMAAITADPRYQAGDLDLDAAWYRLHFAGALRRPELTEELVTRLRRGFTSRGVVAARVIEQRLYSETREGSGYDLLRRLGALRLPTLVLHGDSDFIPLEIVAPIASAIPGARLEVLPACGHFAFLEQPERTAEAIGELLGEW
jgi:proline iminopeptidase